MIDLANIVFLIAFIALPISIGIWALVTRRDLINRYTWHPGPAFDPEPEYDPEPDDVQETLPQPAVAPPPVHVPAQETIEMPRVGPLVVPGASAATVSLRAVHRVASKGRYPQPRYASRSGGVVQRLRSSRPVGFLRTR